jgi:putative oxidoreductase
VPSEALDACGRRDGRSSVGWQLQLVLTVLIAHLCGTFLVLVVLPQAAFERGNLLLLTTIGEFVVKNVVFIAAALLLAAWPRTAPAPARGPM